MKEQSGNERYKQKKYNKLKGIIRDKEGKQGDRKEKKGIQHL